MSIALACVAGVITGELISVSLIVILEWIRGKGEDENS